MDLFSLILLLIFKHYIYNFSYFINMGNCFNRKRYIVNKRQLVKVCPRTEGANMIVTNKVTFNIYYLWYDETEKNTITIGMIIDCINDYENTVCSFALHKSIPRSMYITKSTTIKEYVERSIKTPGYQCFNYGYICLPIR